MPESRNRKLRGGSNANGAALAKAGSSPSWYAPVMVGLMLIGLLWVVTFYLTAGAWPIGSLGNWNLGIGFALIMAGFIMTTNWK